MEITRWKKENRDDNTPTTATATSTTTTTFSDIRKRFGHHRKSIKNRMRKFYNRNGGINNNGDQLCDNCPNDSNEDLGSQGASCSSTASESGGRSSSENNSEKGLFVMNRVEAFRKRDRHLFGSIGLLKKSRTAACLEDVTPRKKVIVAATAAPLTKTNELKKKNNNKCLVENVNIKRCHRYIYSF